LMDCFDLFTEKEQLGENDLWYCSKCKGHVAAYKKFDLWTAPDLLILHLKRFEYIPGQYFMHRQKIESLVDFPIEELDLRHMVKSGQARAGHVRPDVEPLYELFGVSEHMGGLGGGHYTAVVKNVQSGGWFACDDTRVTPVSRDAGVTPNAYVLFYQRKGAAAKWAGIIPPPPGKAASPAAKR